MWPIKLAYLETWLRNQDKKFRVKTKVKLIGGIAYSQGRQLSGENTVLIETYDDGQARVTFIYDGAFDMENGRLVIHKREGTLPDISNEANRAVPFGGVEGAISGMSLLIRKYDSISLERRGSRAILRASHGRTSGVITNLSFIQSDYFHILHANPKLSTIQVGMPGKFSHNQEFDVRWVVRPIEGNSLANIKAMISANRIQTVENMIDGFLFEHIEGFYHRVISLSSMVAQLISCFALVTAIHGLLPPLLFTVVYGGAIALAWFLTRLTFRHQRWFDFLIQTLSTITVVNSIYLAHKYWKKD